MRRTILPAAVAGAGIPVSTWNYIADGERVRHLGAFAEDSGPPSGWAWTTAPSGCWTSPG
jgi:hypothetical protein